MKTYVGMDVRTAPFIYHLDTRWRRVVSYTSQTFSLGRRESPWTPWIRNGNPLLLKRNEPSFSHHTESSLIVILTQAQWKVCKSNDNESSEDGMSVQHRIGMLIGHREALCTWLGFNRSVGPTLFAKQKCLVYF
jgi:hypothetical protein